MTTDLATLPDPTQAPIVFLVESPADALALQEQGFLAVTPPGGIDTPWLSASTIHLRGRSVVILPTSPLAWSWAVNVAKHLNNSAKEVLTLRLPALASGQSIAAWFANGHSEVELAKFINDRLL